MYSKSLNWEAPGVTCNRPEATEISAIGTKSKSLLRGLTVELSGAHADA